MLEVNIKGTARQPEMNYDFCVPPGITAIVGPSGAGKTSLLRAIAGLDELYQGYIKLDGKTLGSRLEKRAVGMVFQNTRLLPHLRVAQNIVLDRKGGRDIDALAKELGIFPHLSRFPRQLSGGEQQRIMIARALFGNPLLMLFDEPLSAIDPALKTELIRLIKNQFNRANIPVLYVTHQMEEAAQLADQLLVLDKGEIIAHGPTAKIMGQLGAEAHFERGLSSTLSGVVKQIDNAYGLARIALGSQFVEVPSEGLRLEDKVRLRLWARDVMVSKNKLIAISARNQLKGKIKALEPIDAVRVQLIADVEGHVVRAQIMRKTGVELSLATGDEIYLVFKSASVE